MGHDITEHLKKAEAVIGQAKQLLAKHGYPDELRTAIVIGFIDQMVEHHEAMLLLIRNGKVGSAFALARSIVESMYRGLWVNLCANDAEIRGFEQGDKLPVNMNEMAVAIDDRYHASGFFQNLKDRSWASLCSYTHTGMLQLGRRFTGHNVQPAYTNGEINEATTSATTCLLLLVGKFLAVQGHADDCREVEGLRGTYGLAAQNNVPI
jgi:Family of unknown function (DUF6988)